jgi:hypothetical protein
VSAQQKGIDVLVQESGNTRSLVVARSVLGTREEDLVISPDGSTIVASYALFRRRDNTDQKNIELFGERGKTIAAFDRMLAPDAEVPPAAPEKRNPLPPEYITLANQLADPINNQASTSKKEFAQVLAAANSALLDFSAIKSDDREIQFVAQEATAGCRDFVDSLKRSELLPRPPGDFPVFLESFVYGYFGQLSAAVQQGQKYQAQADALIAEGRVAATAVQQVKAAQLLLPRIARRFCGPAVENGQALLVNLYPRWGCYSKFDVLELTNNTAQQSPPLHNCTIKVKLEAANGEAVENVHFIRAWKQGESMNAQYWGGLDLGTGKLVCRQTLNDISKVTVSLWCDELTQEDIVAVYTQADRAAQITERCRPLDFRLSYRPFAAGALFNDERGIYATMGGLPYIPPCRVQVTFRKQKDSDPMSDGTVSRVWDVTNNWTEGSSMLFSSKDFTWDPAVVEISVSFPDGGGSSSRLELPPPAAP